MIQPEQSPYTAEETALIRKRQAARSRVMGDITMRLDSLSVPSVVEVKRGSLIRILSRQSMIDHDLRYILCVRLRKARKDV